jgi:hypothetical protein
MVVDPVLHRMNGAQAGETAFDEFGEAKPQTADNAGAVQAQKKLNALFCHD